MPRCGVTQVQIICYLSSRQCLRSAGSRIGELERSMGSGVNLDNWKHTVYHSSFEHGDRVCKLVQPLTDLSATRLDHADMKKTVYQCLFDHTHPKVSLMHRFDKAYRERWSKPGCLNIPRPRVLSEKAISRLNSLLVCGLYVFHCWTRHSSTMAECHKETKASITRLMAEVSMCARLPTSWSRYLRLMVCDVPDIFD